MSDHLDHLSPEARDRVRRAANRHQARIARHQANPTQGEPMNIIQPTSIAVARTRNFAFGTLSLRIADDADVSHSISDHGLGTDVLLTDDELLALHRILCEVYGPDARSGGAS